MEVQLYSEKCTGQYFKVRDRVIMYVQNDIYEKYSKICVSILYVYKYIYISNKLKHNKGFFYSTFG